MWPELELMSDEGHWGISMKNKTIGKPTAMVEKGKLQPPECIALGGSLLHECVPELKQTCFYLPHFHLH